MSSNVIADTYGLGQRVNNIVKVLDSYGDPVPQDVRDALEFHAVTYEPNHSGEAWLNLVHSTPATFTQCADEYAKALSVDYTAKHESFQWSLTQARNGRLTQSLLNHEDELYSTICGRFNTIAPDFERVCLELPNLVSLNVWQLSPGQTQALQDAKAVVGELTTLRGAYNGLGSALGKDRDGDTREVSSFIDTVCELGRPHTFSVAYDAADFLRVDKLGVDGTKPYQPLLPFAALTFRSIPLELKTPGEASRLRLQIQDGG